MENKKFLDLDGLEYYNDKIQSKLDAKVDSSSLSNYYTKSQTDAKIAEVSEEVGPQRLIEYRKDHYDNYALMSKPDEFTEDFFKSFNLYTNGKGNYIVNYNKNDYLNQNSTHHWYFAPDGNDSNSGADFEHAKAHCATTFISTYLQEGDTIHLKSGIYPRDTPFANAAIPHGVNIVCDGEAILTHYENTLVWTQYGNNSWSTTRSGINTLYDITKFKSEGKVSKLQLVESAAVVDTTPNSYFVSGTTVYVHLYDNVTPSIETLGVSLAAGYPSIKFTPSANNTKVYIENVSILGADTGGIVCDATSYTGCSVLLKDVKIYNTFAREYQYDAFSNIGFTSICDHVIIVNTEKDGFNYHNSSTIPAYGLEINCTCNNCGEIQTIAARLSNNATTAHQDCKVIRVNGDYTLCNGGEVVDVGNAVGACYNCLIADSYRGRVYDAYATDNAILYLYNCYFKGSTAPRNITTGMNSAVIYIKDCEYDTKSGHVIDLDEE